MTTRNDGRTSKSPGQLFSVPAAAARLECSEMHIYRLIAAGELDAIDIAQPGARKAKTRVSEAKLGCLHRGPDAPCRCSPQCPGRCCRPADAGSASAIHPIQAVTPAAPRASRNRPRPLPGRLTSPPSRP